MLVPRFFKVAVAVIGSVLRMHVAGMQLLPLPGVAVRGH